MRRAASDAGTPEAGGSGDRGTNMIASLIITFRETLEAALVTGIVLSYLARTRQTRYNRVVYAGVASGLVAALIGAFLFSILGRGLEGRAEQLFEGITMLLGALLLTTMILWMMRQRHVAQELETRVAVEVAQANSWGLFSLVFLAVLREGIETVIFLGAATAASAGGDLTGALIVSVRPSSSAMWPLSVRAR